MSIYQLNHNKIIGLIMALGLGVGIGLTIFQNPDSSYADANYQYADQQSQIKQLTILSLTTNVISQEELKNISQQNVSIQKKSSKNYSQITTLCFPSLNLLKKITLGDSIQVTKSNNGIYKYKVIAIKTLDKNNINSLYIENKDTIVVYAHQGLINQSIYAIIAKPAS